MFPIDDWDPGRMMDGYDGNGTMMNGGGWVMMFMGLLLLLALVGLMIFLTLRVTGPGSTGRSAASSTGSPREVLDLRLARGEIGEEEYGTARRLLDA